MPESIVDVETIKIDKSTRYFGVEVVTSRKQLGYPSSKKALVSSPVKDLCWLLRDGWVCVRGGGFRFVNSWVSERYILISMWSPVEGGLSICCPLTNSHSLNPNRWWLASHPCRCWWWHAFWTQHDLVNATRRSHRAQSIPVHRDEGSQNWACLCPQSLWWLRIQRYHSPLVP